MVDSESVETMSPEGNNNVSSTACKERSTTCDSNGRYKHLILHPEKQEKPKRQKSDKKKELEMGASHCCVIL
jgi:hypothetical protein